MCHYLSIDELHLTPTLGLVGSAPKKYIEEHRSNPSCTVVVVFGN